MASIELSGDLRSVAQARRFVADQARGHVEDLDDLLLMASELVANVVEHARTSVTVEVIVGPPLRVEVSDGAAASQAFRDLLAAPRSAPPGAPRGRGLWLVHRLASRVGLAEDAAGGKTVWFEVAPAGPQPPGAH